MGIAQPFSVEVKDVMDLMEKSIEQGMSVAKLLGDLELSPDYLDDPHSLIDMKTCWRIIVANQNAIAEESHLMSSRPLKRGTTRLIFSNLCHCKTLQEGLQSLADTYNIVHGGDYNFVRKRGNTLSYIVDDESFHYLVKPNTFAIEFALLKIHCALSYLTGKQLKLVRMATKRKALPDHQHHLKIFDAKLLVDQPCYELVYESSQGELPFNIDDDTDITGNIYAHFLSMLQGRNKDKFGDSFVQQTLNNILHASANGNACQEGIANSMNMSVATMRRRLSDQDISFRQLLDKVNSELSVNYFHEQATPADVAERLGYSDIRSFKRAFKRWYGMSPAAYIKSHKLLK